MTLISKLPPQMAPALEPLLRQVHDLHVARQPDIYAPTPHPSELRTFLSGWLSQPRVTALVAGAPDAPQGYLIYEEHDKPANLLKRASHYAMLEHICVDQNCRQSGIGRALITDMQRRCRTASILRIRVSYASFNTASARLMTQMGLVPVTVFAEGPS